MKPRSHEVTDGPERAPARAMLRAIGMTDDDWGKSQVGVCSSWNEVTPCNMPLDRLAKRAKEGVRAAGGYPIEFMTIAVSDGISMGHEGMRASLVSRGDRRLDRDRDARRALRRHGHVRRVRQEPARHAHGRGPAEPAVGVPLRRLDPARPPRRRHRPRHRERVRSGRRARHGRDQRRRAQEHRVPRLPERGQLRRHVHRQHDGVGRPRRSACRSPARRRAGPRLAARRLRVRVRRGGDQPARARPAAPPDHDEGRVRERHRRHHGAGRLDQRGAAPAGHRQRGPGRARARRLQPGGGARAPHRRHQAARQVPHGRPRRASAACPW